jgi:hypothetical protein
MAGRIDLVEEERRRNAQAVAPQATSGASVPAQVPVSQPVAQPQPQVQSPAPVPGTVGTAIPDVGTAPLQAPSLTQAPVKPEATPLSMYDKFADMTAEQAINTGEITPQGYWNIQSEAIKAGKRDPYSTEEIIEMMRTSDPEYETGEQRARRERNDRASRAITGISDLISNIAGMVGTAKGSSPVVVNNLAPLDARQREITERRNALKRKYDTLLTNAKMGEIAYQRDLEAARQKAQRDYRLKLALKDIDARIRKGEIDQKQANVMTLEAYRQANRMATEQFKAENRSKEEAANRANQIKVANIRSGGSGESGKRGIITIPTANGYVDVKEKSFNDPTVTSILYNQLDPEYKISDTDRSGNSKTPTRDEMKQAIGRWVADGHELNIPQSIIESEDSFNIDDYEVKESDFEDNKVGKRKK